MAGRGTWVPATLRCPTPWCPACCTHACSPARGAPSGRGHTLGTAAPQPPASSDTVHSGGGTQGPWRLVHRRTGGNPRSPRSRSVLPAGTGVVTVLPSPQDPASSTPSTISFCPGSPRPTFSTEAPPLQPQARPSSPEAPPLQPQAPLQSQDSTLVQGLPLPGSPT